MDRLLQTRRQNLRREVEARGGPSAVSKLLGHSNGTYLPQLIGPNPIRDISEQSARRIEEKLHLPYGSLDIDTDETPPSAKETLQLAFSELLNTLGPDGIGSISEQQFASLCEALLAQYRETGNLSPTFVKRIVRLVRGTA